MLARLSRRSAALLALPLAVACALSPSASQAATATTTLPVAATVLSVCLVTALPLVFGNYSSAQTDANATLTVTCSPGSAYNVGLDAGAGTGATTATRKMAFLTNTLDYTLFRDSNRTLNWGNTVGTDTSTGTGTGLPQILTVYGRIPAGQFAALGAYTDLVNVTVTY